MGLEECQNGFILTRSVAQQDSFTSKMDGNFMHFGA